MRIAVIVWADEISRQVKTRLRALTASSLRRVCFNTC
jgi:hypothetical protein